MSAFRITMNKDFKKEIRIGAKNMKKKITASKIVARKKQRFAKRVQGLEKKMLALEKKRARVVAAELKKQEKLLKKEQREAKKAEKANRPKRKYTRRSPEEKEAAQREKKVAAEKRALRKQERLANKAATRKYAIRRTKEQIQEDIMSKELARRAKFDKMFAEKYSLSKRQISSIRRKAANKV